MPKAGMHHTSSPKQRSRRSNLPPHVLYVLVAALSLGIIIIMWNIYQLRMMQDSHFNSHGVYPNNVAEALGGVIGGRRPIVWIHAKHATSGYLDHVMAVFDHLGYIRGGPDTTWDVLWAHDYPFTEMAAVMAKLKSHQKVNHFPGTGYITNKVYLATSDIKYIPKAFQMPDQRDAFLMETKMNRDTLWVQKSSSHRGIKVKSIDDLELYASNTFIQRYISNPYLIDGKKFDIGLYVVLTSVNPLRVYMLDDEMLIRFCSKDYNPVDFTDVGKYVVGDDYMPVWKMPSLQKYYNEYQYNFKESLDAYWRSEGIDPSDIYNQVYEAVHSVFVKKYPHLLNGLQRHQNKHTFFELMRFDFVLDEDLNVFLMEVNMSPNLSSAHFHQNKHLYERVVYNVLSVTGVARDTPLGLQNRGADEKQMRVSEREVQIKAEVCGSSQCLTCVPQECRVCYKCLTPSQKSILQDAYLEHYNRHSMRRVYPESLIQDEAINYDTTLDKDLNQNDQMMREWFAAKCARDRSWCQ